MLLFFVGNSAMNIPRYWQRRNESSALLETAKKMPSCPLPPVQIHYGVMNFIPALAIRSQLVNSCTRWHEILKGLSQDGQRADFSKKRCNKGLSNVPNFGWIYLARQYLLLTFQLLDFPFVAFKVENPCLFISFESLKKLPWIAEYICKLSDMKNGIISKPNPSLSSISKLKDRRLWVDH